MKIDHDYLKELLEAFEVSDEPVTNIERLAAQGFSHTDDKFIFHLRILEDQKLVKSEQGNNLGFRRGASGNFAWSVVPLRLTAFGHDFLEALRNQEIWGTIQTEFKDASIGTLWRVSKELLEGYVRKKVTSLLTEDN